MSYEGYEVHFCTNGHITTIDVYDDALKCCPECSSSIQHVGHVDETNGLPYLLNFKAKQLTPAKYLVATATFQSRKLEYRHEVSPGTYEFIKLDEAEESPDGDFIIGKISPLDVSEEG